MHKNNQSGSFHNAPTVRRDLKVIGDRVVRLETRQLSETTWSAIGIVSPKIPTGKYLSRPVEVRATGRTESEALDSLRHRIEGMDHATDQL